MPTLFDPLALGALTIPNRILMAPMTRGRATRDHVPTALMADHYAQRASAGLIISEAIGISRQGLGWPYAPGLWSEAQVAAWKPVTEAVHDRGGRIVAQLWHMGRMTHSALTGEQPVSSSATATPGEAYLYAGKAPYEIARPLDVAEIPGIVAQYVLAARHAIIAGFDGVQIHAGNGQLIDQFLRNNSNFRTDSYGGDVPNRIRLLIEVTQAVAGAVGADRTSVRLSPNGETYGVDDSDPTPLFEAVAIALNPIGLSFLELKEASPEGTFVSTDAPRQSPMMRPHFNGSLVLNSDYTPARAQADLDSGLADAISFGRPFLANPDLVERLREGAPLNPVEEATLYTQGAEGYIDYPALADSKAAA